MFKRVMAMAVGLAMLASPVAAQVVKVKYMAPYPAKVGEAAKLRRIAVLDFDGSEGGRFGATLQAELRSALYNAKPYFEVISAEGVVAEAPPPPPPPPPPPAPTGKRGAAPKPVSTIKVIPVADTPVARAIRIGRAAQVQGVFIGEVTAAMQKLESQESRTINGQQTTVPCTTTTVNFTVVPKLVNVETGQVSYSRTVASKDSYKVCAGQVDKPLTESVKDIFCGLIPCKKKVAATNQTAAGISVESDLDLITKVSKQATEAILGDVAPYNANTDIPYYADALLPDKAARNQFKVAATFAKALRFDRACAMWEALKTPETQTNAALMFNIAICTWFELPDNPAVALKLMREAEAMDTRGYNKDVDAAIKLLEAAVNNQSELAKQVKGS